jgi:DNA processing protein
MDAGGAVVAPELAALARAVGARDAERFGARLAARNTRVWRRTDADFPIGDADGLPDMPAVLLGEGDRPDAFRRPRVAIVGTRAATPAGLADARELGSTLARAGITVVSGLAIGIDGAAQQGALDAGGLTVGVVATGLDVVYPRRHGTLFTRVREHGLVVGEHDFGVQPLPWRFPIRNRIIAALSDAVVVVEATRAGGARITADYAGDYGRPLFALPGSRRNPAAVGCNELIAEGAIPVLDPTSVLLALGRGGIAPGDWEPVAEPDDGDQRAVLRALAGHAASIDELARAASLPTARLGAALRALERTGRIERKRGLWWSR